MASRILIVDDSDTNLGLLESVLAAEGYELHLASNGKEACDAALRLQPDLVLIDVMMPGMDGFAVCRYLRATPLLAGIPIVMLTALNDLASRLQGIEAGADDFISKPFSMPELRARIRTIIRLNRYRALAEQRARFERLFAFSPSAILIIGPDGTLSALNAMAEALFVRPAGPPLHGAALDSFLPASAVGLILRLIASARSGSYPPPVTLRLPTPGTDCILQVRAAGLAESNGPQVMLILDDVTAEVRAREALEAMNRNLDGLVRARTSQLEEANQLLLSYAAFVSHDLRSPLSVVMGYLSYLETGPLQLDPAVKSCVGRAYAASVMMEEMITNILRLAVDEHAAIRPDVTINPRPVIDRLCEKLGGLWPDVPVRFIVHPMPLVLSTPPLLDRVFFNLIVNAIKYAAGCGAPVVEIGGFDSPEGPVLYVRDNGVGFDARDADRLFREFSRLPGAEASDGLGLGLSLVAKLLRAHHGCIWADGRPGEGATFFVRFSSSGINGSERSSPQPESL